MEHLAFSGGRKLIYGRPFTVFQHVMLSLLLFTTYSARQVLSSSRNAAYIEEMVESTGVPIWDENREKTELKCSNFHQIRFPELFYYWPEDSPLFHHCCFDGSITKEPKPFRYSQFGQLLGYATYRDVGYFDQCLPFWGCRATYLAILETYIYYASCERTDLTRLYWSRFWRLLVWKYSFLQTLLPWIPIMEAAVILVALAVFPLTWQHAGENPSKASGWNDLVPTGKIWVKSTWKRVLMDWGHLYLLAMVGNCLIEAMRRQDIYTMQSKLFFAYSTLYLVLFVILSAASVLQQLAYWIGSATEPTVLNYWVGKKNGGHWVHSPRTLKNMNAQPSSGHARAGISPLGIHTSKVSFASENDHPYSPSDLTTELTPRSKVHNTTYHGGSSVEYTSEGQAEIHTDEEEKAILQDSRQHDCSILSSILKRLCCCFCPKSTSEPSKLKKISRSLRKYLSVHVFEMGDDYKWQPIATQVAIVFALSSFLTFPVDDDSQASNLFGILLGYLVQAGCLWTGIYAVLVLFQRAAYICRFFHKLRTKDSDDTRILEYQMHSKFPGRPYP